MSHKVVWNPIIDFIDSSFFRVYRDGKEERWYLEAKIEFLEIRTAGDPLVYYRPLNPKITLSELKTELQRGK